MTRTTMAARVEEYLTFRRGLGYRPLVEGRLLRQFARFADRAGRRGPLTTELALRWAVSPSGSDRLYQARRLEVVRPFARHLAVTDPATEIPARGLLGPAHRRTRPHIFSAGEVTGLMAAADRLQPTGGLRPPTYRTLIGLLAHLETGRGNSVRTRNARLTAVRAFLTYASSRDPTALPVAQRVLAIPRKRYDRPLLGHLTRPEVQGTHPADHVLDRSSTFGGGFVPRGFAHVRADCSARCAASSTARPNVCNHEYIRSAAPTCQHVRSVPVDLAVTELFLIALTPAKIEIALKALEELEADHQARRRQWDLHLRRADYEVELARRRYEVGDPANRLVAAALEAEWEAALRRREQLVRERADVDRSPAASLPEADRLRIRELAGNLGQVWSAETTTMEERKALLRVLVKRVHVDGVSEAGKVRIEVEWHTATRTSLSVDRPPTHAWLRRTSAEVLDRIHQLLADHTYDAIAKRLNREGYRSAHGKKFTRANIGMHLRNRGQGRRTKKPVDAGEAK